jgi:HEAT repeat protein
LAKVIQEMRPEAVLANFSPKRREELRKLPPEQMAAEVIEDSAVKWAVERMASAPDDESGLIVEEEVIRVLLRSLQATQMADRLAQKLAQYVADLNMPPSKTAGIQAELSWVTLAPEKKTEEFLKRDHFDRSWFRRLVDHIQELIKKQDHQNASLIALHYCKFLDSQSLLPEDLGRLPELVRVTGGIRSTFLKDVVPKLQGAFARTIDESFTHLQLLNGFSAITKSLGIFEDFEQIESIGKSIESVAVADLEKHGSCCMMALQNLLTSNAVERLVEINVQRKDDPKWARTAVSLLRWSGQPAIMRVFRQLEEEQVATNRMALIRFISKIGPAALDVARSQIRHERWYVVRNTCRLLADLKDPELLVHIAPALRHPDERVQKAAVKAIFESRKPERGPVLAEALPYVHPSVRDEVLDDLRFLRDPKTAAGLERFVFGDQRANVPLVTKAVQVLGAIPGDESESVLYQVMIDAKLEMPVRQAAYQVLHQSKSPTAKRRLLDFARPDNPDPLAAIIRQNVAWDDRAY